MPKLTFAKLEVGMLFVAIKVIPCDVRGERIADNATLWRKVTDTRAVQAMCFEPIIWSKADRPFDPSYRIVAILPG
jgi:hypothetical protein